MLKTHQHASNTSERTRTSTPPPESALFNKYRRLTNIFHNYFRNRNPPSANNNRALRSKFNIDISFVQLCTCQNYALFCHTYKSYWCTAPLYLENTIINYLFIALHGYTTKKPAIVGIENNNFYKKAPSKNQLNIKTTREKVTNLSQSTTSPILYAMTAAVLRDKSDYRVSRRF